MRIGYWYAGGLGLPSDPFLRMLKQVGVDDLVVGDLPIAPGRRAPAALDLIEFRVRCQDYGLELIAVENLAPQHRFLEPVILGTPERDEAVASVIEAIENIGAAGIPYLGYYWFVPAEVGGAHGVIRTSWATPLASGARSWQFDIDEIRLMARFRERDYSAEEIRENHDRFLADVLPVARDAGVTLSLHPDDPPVAAGLGGIGRVFSTFEGFARAGEIAGDGPWGLTLCIGNWQLIGDDALQQALVHFGDSRRINYVHMQPVRGTAERFLECEFDAADTDFANVIATLRDVGFDGTVFPSHWPIYDGDDEHQTRSLAMSVGYLRGLFSAAGVDCPIATDDRAFTDRDTRRPV